MPKTATTEYCSRRLLERAASVRLLAVGMLVSLTASAYAVAPVQALEPTANAPVQTMGAGVPLALSGLAAVALLLVLYRLRHRPALACPGCGSHKCAHVGQVGASRNAYRCHNCGFLWEPDFGAFGRPSSDSPGA